MFGSYNQPQYMPQYQSPYQARLDALQQPQMYQQQTPAQQSLTRVTGMEGARAYQMGPNSVVALFDANDDVFFVKSTDGAGFPTIRPFRFTPLEDAPTAQPDFVTRAEFEELKGMILNGKQSIRKSKSDVPDADAGK